MFGKKSEITRDEVQRMVAEAVKFELSGSVEIAVHKALEPIDERLHKQVQQLTHRAMLENDTRLDRIDEKFSIIRKVITCSHLSVHFEPRGRFEGDNTYLKTCAECGYIIGPCTERQKVAYEYDEKAMELAKLKAVLDAMPNTKGGNQ